MAIIIDRTITIKDDKATLDRPLYLYIGDGDITCLFTIEEKKKAATFGAINKTNTITENASYGEVRIYKPDKGSDGTSRLVFTDRAEIIDDKLQVIFSYKNIDDFSEAGIHKLQIHLYDDDDSARNRFTIPPIDINVLLPVGYDNNAIDEAIVGYSLLDRAGEEVPTFYYDEEGNYNYNKTEWQTGDIITSNKLNKIEDALYEIKAADANFVTNEALDIALDDKANAAHNHTTANITGLHRVATSGSYNDLSNKPTIPNTSNFATKTELAGKADDNHDHDDDYADINHSHDDKYATKAELQNIPNIPTKTSQLTNDSGFITSANVPTKTSQLTNDSNFITDIPSEYITKDELETELESYADKDYVIRKINDAQLGGGSGDSGDLSELLNDYATIAQLETVTTQLGNKADNDHQHDNKYAPISHNHDIIYAAYNHNHTQYVTESVVDNKIAAAQLGNGGTPPNLDNYATKEYVDESIREAQLGGGEGSSNVDLSEYAKKTDIAGMVTSNTITRIEVVDALPSDEDLTVLYIVKK